MKTIYNMFLFFYTKIHVREIYIMFRMEAILMLLIGFSQEIK